MVSSSTAQAGTPALSARTGGTGSGPMSGSTASVQRALRGAPTFEDGAALLAPRPVQRKKAGGPDLADSAGPKKNDGAPLAEGGIWSGMLERMRAEDEFVQGSEKSYSWNTLWKACDRAFMKTQPKLTRGVGGQDKGESKEAYEKRKVEWEKKKEAFNSQSLEKQRTVFYQHVCNAQAFFFVQKAPELKRQERALGNDYATFKRFVEDELAAYLTSALSGKNKLVDADGYVLRTPGMDVDARVTKDKPHKMAEKLLGFEGRMVNIKAPGHFFPGEVKGGVLLARDNQNRRAKGKEWRTGDYDLNEVQPDTTSGKTFDFLKKIEHITPATAPIPKDDESAGPGSTSSKPEAAPAPGGTPNAATAPTPTPEPSAGTPGTGKPGQAAATDAAEAQGEGGSKAFTPPKQGVATTTVLLRGQPRIGAGSAKLRNIVKDTPLLLKSEEQTDDRTYPQWFGVNLGGREGYVAGKFVKVESTPAAAEPTTTDANAQTSGGPTPETKPDPKPEGSGGGAEAPLFFSGHLARMRKEKEFIQINPGTERSTLHKACKYALEQLQIPKAQMQGQLTNLRDHACALQSAFFIDNQTAIRKANATMEYEPFKAWILSVMGPYFHRQFTTKVKGRKDGATIADAKTGFMNDNSPVLNSKAGCDATDSPYKKALGILACEGRMIRIGVESHGGWHFFPGEVRGGVLHAWDNQGDDAGRSGEFDLKTMTPETKSGRVYDHLKNPKKFKSCSPGWTDDEKAQRKADAEKEEQAEAERKAKKEEKKKTR